MLFTWYVAMDRVVGGGKRQVMILVIVHFEVSRIIIFYLPMTVAQKGQREYFKDMLAASVEKMKPEEDYEDAQHAYDMTLAERCSC